jgi:uncharacterized protein YcfJ
MYWVLLVFLGGVGVCMAQDMGRVISSQAVIQQVQVPRQVCTNQQVEVQPQKSGSGAVLGGIAGGAIGNAAGNGRERAAATVIGAIGGAIIGDRMEGTPDPQVRTVQNCVNQIFTENRTVGYNVVYEFGGKQYSVQMPQDPGPTIQLQVTPVGTQSGVQTYPGSASVVPPVYQQAPIVIESRPIFRPYYVEPYYYGYWGRDHHHWR